MVVALVGPRTAQPPLVCLHGLSANRTTWLPVALRLGDRRRMVLVDLLGRGESDASAEAAYDLDSEAKRLATVLERLRLSRPVLAGHSHGAAIAVATARRVGACGLLLVNPVTPELARPAALSLLRHPPVRRGVSVVVRLFRRPLTRYMLVRRVFADGDSIPPGAITRYAKPWGDPRRAAVLPRVLRDWRPAELEAWAGQPGIPVTVIAGSMDRRIEPELASRWTERLGGTFHLVAGCGHSAPEERPDYVARILEELLSEIGTREQEAIRDDQE